MSGRLSVTRRYSVETTEHPKTFSLSGIHTILVFFTPNGTAIWRRGPHNGGVECRGYEKSTKISLYLGNDTSYSHSYYGRRIGNLTQAFDLYRFEWSWVISNTDFKVTPLFNAEYVRNGTRYNEKLIVTVPYSRVSLSFRKWLSEVT